MDLHDFLWNACLFLLVTVIALPLSKKMGLGSVLGYLIAGVIIGPWGLKQITNPTEIMHFSEFGVVLLLFLIGLELNPRRLWALRQPIFGMGGLQVLLSAVAVTAMVMLLNWSWRTGVVVGMGLALSSTAIVLQSMSERNILKTPVGQQAFSVLLFQDLVVIPMLAVLPLLVVGDTVSQGVAPWQTLGKMLGAITAVVLVGRYLLRWLLRIVAATNMREALTAASLLTVVGIAELMNAAGLSMALGSFLAGVLLADSEYRHELEIDIEPFKGLLLGLFFTSVGMSMDFGLFAVRGPAIIGLAIGIMLAKLVVLVLVGWLFRVSPYDRPLFSLLLCQGGEFAFVLFGAAQGLGVLAADEAMFFNMVVAVSMVFSPLLLVAFDRLVQPKLVNLGSGRPADSVPLASGGHPVLIAGFGRYGQIVGRMLHSLHIPTTILDHDPNQIDLLKRFGFEVYYGDAARRELLEAAHINEAKVLVIAIDDIEATLEIAKMARQHYPHLRLFARARNRAHSYRLMDLGVEDIFRETFDSALNMSQHVLTALGYSPYRALRMAKTFAAHDRKLLHESHQHYHDEQKVVAIGKRARQELASLMEEDLRESRYPGDESWESTQPHVGGGGRPASSPGSSSHL
jgi:glutathione-regulated potassium-efflux system ancillary protein KefC